MDTKKRIAYLLAVGIVLLIVRSRIGSSLPQFASLGIAIILTIVAVGRLIMERRLNTPFFYGYARNWNGGYFINSAFLLGLATFFYAVTMTYGVIALVLETAIYLLLCKVIKTHVTDSAKQ